MSENTINSALVTWDGPLGLPRFDAISDDDYGPAMRAGMVEELAEIDAIANQSAEPTFANTIEAMERSGKALSRAATLFFQKAGNDTNPAIQKLEREFAALFARHSAAITGNAKLFARIDALWQKRDSLGLTGEQHRVLKKTHRGFVHQGAALAQEERLRMNAINERLAELGTAFAQNVLHDEADWALVLDDKADLDGLPGSLVSAMASAASDRGHEGKWAVTLGRSIIDPFLTFSKRRELREKAYKAWTMRGEHDGDHDNRPVIAEMLKLRAERAKLLGHRSFAELKLDGTMAKTPDAVNALLETVWEKAKQRAAEEAADIAGLMAKDGANHELEGSDWRFYAEQIRAARYAYSDDEVRPYMRLESMIAAAFDVAKRLFGLTFEEKKGVPLYHPDARVWQVFDGDGNPVAVFIGDYFARASKRSGAWMSAMQYQSKLLGETPIITNTMNFAKPAKGEDAFLSFEDARTLFHEFGHALHGMLSNVTYPSVSGTSVSRDFVELPSQLYEHWLTVPEVLNTFALHDKTGEPMPKDLLDKVLAARNFNMGFATVEYTSSALVDMAYHQAEDAPIDPMVHESEVLAGLDMPKAIAMRHRSPHFQHIFSGDGYAAGYYSYMWSEVMDADAFNAFEEKNDPFDPETAARLHKHIYSSGGTMEPDEAYIAFRGRLPSPDAMMAKRGF